MDCQRTGVSAPPYNPRPMEKRRDIRRFALMLLYQMDLSGEANPATASKGVTDDLLAENDIVPDSAVREAAVTLAAGAWGMHEACDKLSTLHAPGWPSARQPAMDRALIRLGYHEMVSGHAPARVAINEAIELAKTFGGEKSPAFVNGVLDKIAKEVKLPAESAESEAKGAAKDAAKKKPADADVWLDDAKKA